MRRPGDAERAQASPVDEPAGPLKLLDAFRPAPIHITRPVRLDQKRSKECPVRRQIIVTNLGTVYICQ